MNIKEARDEIIHTVKAYLQKDENGAYCIPPVNQRPLLLMGPPGIGKTRIMEQAARACGVALVSYTITHHTRQSAVGLPTLQKETLGGKERTVTVYTMSEIIGSIYRRMEETGLKEGILFLDEINCVSETLAPTMLQFLQNKTFGNEAVPEGWVIAAAGNPPEYNRSVREFDIVTLDRVRRMDITPDFSVWMEYARGQRLHPAILSYLSLRPQHFYTVVPDVDGARFVTARGWEDLSRLLTVYEQLSIPVDAGVVGEFLQHEEIARDVAAYFDLYKKYRDDYGVEGILQGSPSPQAFQRVYKAPFDERLSLVNLLLSGLFTRFAGALDREDVVDDCYAFLKQYRTALATAAESPAALYRALLQQRETVLQQQKAAGLLSPRALSLRQDAQRALLTLTPSALEGDAAFEECRRGVEALVGEKEEWEDRAESALDHALDFVEAAFENGQESVVFLTELALHPDANRFLSGHPNDRFAQKSRTLLLSSRREALLDTLRRG